MHPFDNDHDYCEESPADHFLKVDTVTNISCEQATKIEEETRDQAVTAMWHLEHAKHIAASRFGQICKMTDKTDATKLDRRLQQINNISAAPLEHGRKYENTVIQAYC